MWGRIKPYQFIKQEEVIFIYIPLLEMRTLPFAMCKKAIYRRTLPTLEVLCTIRKKLRVW